jgi:hypothetical protein
MSKAIDLDARLGRLSKTVKAGIAKRNEQAQVTQSAKQARKASDWQTVQEQHPDVAAWISEMGAVFGNPASVKVTSNGGDVILDTARYGS